MAEVLNIPEVFHVGSLETASRTDRASLEAFMLSVSLDPEDWTSIARCAGTTWSLACERARWLDAMALDDTAMTEISTWGMERGYIRPAVLWRAWHYDDEGDTWRYMTCLSESQAILETEDVEFEAGEIPSASGTPVDKVDGVLLTDEGMAALERWHDRTMGLEGTLILWAREVLLPEDPDLVGIWWNEDHDPQSLSCPRGGIFPERLELFEIRDPAGNVPPFREPRGPEP